MEGTVKKVRNRERLGLDRRSSLHPVPTYRDKRGWNECGVQVEKAKERDAES